MCVACEWADEFSDFFSQFGEVKEHQIMRDHSTGRTRGFGFVTFETEQAVDNLLDKGNKLEFAGAQVSCLLKERPYHVISCVESKILECISYCIC